MSQKIISGVIALKYETAYYGSSSFAKRNFILTTEEQYPQKLVIELLQDNVDLIDSYQVGDKVHVHINIRGREWINPQGEAKYFNSLVGYRIVPQEKHVPSLPPDVSSNNSTNNSNGVNHDDLPF